MMARAGNRENRGRPMPGQFSFVQRGGALIAALALTAAQANAAELVPLRVNAFPNAKALPLHAGIAKGIFARHGLDLALQLTENSKSQREGLAAGTFEIAQAALD